VHYWMQSGEVCYFTDRQAFDAGWQAGFAYYGRDPDDADMGSGDYETGFWAGLIDAQAQRIEDDRGTV